VTGRDHARGTQNRFSPRIGRRRAFSRQ
jgi:hypothetical protein